MNRLPLAHYQFEIGARFARANWAAAAELAAECRAQYPNETDGWLLGSMAALFADRKDQALLLIEERLQAEPRDTQCLIQHAECLYALGHRLRAIAAAEAAADTAGKVPEALDAIATFMAFVHDHARAVQVYDRAVDAAPNDHTFLAKRAVMHQFLGEFDLATRDFTAALSLCPTDAESLKGLADLKRQSTGGNFAAQMEAALAGVPPDSKDAATLHFGLAKTYEDLADYPASWRHLSAGNKLERSQIKYVPDQDRDTVERIIAGFPDLQERTADSTGESPIFIVGLPRSGTTLVERIIGSHSHVHSAGELSALAESFATVAAAVSPQTVNTWRGLTDSMSDLPGPPIAREYLARARARRGEKPRFSDKAPANFFFCALIFRAFPNARVIHLTRHPLASCYAIFKARFNGGYPFSYDLGELADFYLNYRKLMTHWHRVLPGRILDVAYEDVVTDQEATTRRILEYLDLPFETACLDFHLNPDSTSTSSSVQVRQPLYDSSLHHWRKYATELAPVRERLAAGGIDFDQPLDRLSEGG